MPKYSKERLTLLLLFPAMLLIGFWMLLGLCTKADSVSKVSLSAPLQEQTDRLLQQQTMGSRTLRSFSAGVQYHMGLSQINQVYLTPSRLPSRSMLFIRKIKRRSACLQHRVQRNSIRINFRQAFCFIPRRHSWNDFMTHCRHRFEPLIHIRF